MFMDILKSKRFLVVVITVVAHLLAKYHILLNDAAINDLADQIVLVLAPIAVIYTKIHDSRVKA